MYPAGEVLRDTADMRVRMRSSIRRCVSDYEEDHHEVDRASERASFVSCYKHRASIITGDEALVETTKASLDYPQGCENSQRVNPRRFPRDVWI